MTCRVKLSKSIVLDLHSPDIVGDGFRCWISGESGSGKSSAAALIVAQVIEQGSQVVALDVHGEYGDLWALGPTRVTRIGYGGQPVSLDSVPWCMDVLANNKSLLLDLSHWNSTDPESLDTFMLEFMRGLFTLRQQRPKWTMVLVEEAQCLPLDTEVLTRVGWTNRANLQVGQEVAAFDLKTEACRFEPIQGIQDRRFDGDMLHWKGKRLDYLATPDHRVVVKKIQRGEGRYHDYDWSFIPARTVSSNVKIPFGGPFPELALRKGLPQDPDFFRILGWVITDGSLHSRRTRSICLTQSHVTNKLNMKLAAEMTTVLSQRGVEPKRDRMRVTSRSPQREWYFGVSASKPFLALLEGRNIHRIPRKVLAQASLPQLQALWSGLMEGDGSAWKGRWRTFHNCMKINLDNDFQELCTLLGKASTIRPAFTGSIPTGTQVSVYNERNVHHSIRKRPSKEPFQGPVWDLTIPSGAFIARRKGTVFVTGNCIIPQQQGPGQAKNVRTFLKMITEGRKYGLQFILTSQRLALVDINAIAGCNLRLFLRVSEFKDWKIIKKYLPPTLKVDFNETRYGIKNFPSGAAVLLCRWTSDARIQLLPPGHPPRKPLVEL